MIVLPFRLLILVYLVGQISVACIDFVFPHLIPLAVTQAIRANDPYYSSYGSLLVVLAVLWVTVHFASVIGLLFFLNWSRTLALSSTLVGFALLPFLGTQAYSGWGGALVEASATLWGVILTLSYFGPASKRFIATIHPLSDRSS